MEQGENLLADFPLPPPFFFSHFGNMRTSSETIDFSGKACSKNNSSLERVDSRVQHIWRLRVIGSCGSLLHFWISLLKLLFYYYFIFNIFTQDDTVIVTAINMGPVFTTQGTATIPGTSRPTHS